MHALLCRSFILFFAQTIKYFVWLDLHFVKRKKKRKFFVVFAERKHLEISHVNSFEEGFLKSRH